MNATQHHIRTLRNLPLLALLALLLTAACSDREETARPPRLTDLTGELEEDLRATAVRFSLELPAGHTGQICLYRSGSPDILREEIPEEELTVHTWDGLDPETAYRLVARASTGTSTAADTLDFTTTAAPPYLELLYTSPSAYAFRVRSASEHGFYFSSGEYGALDYLVPGWSPDDQKSLNALLDELYPFTGHGDTTIECIDGEQPDWAEMPIEVKPRARYFILAAERAADGSVDGNIAFLEFYTR